MELTDRQSLVLGGVLRFALRLEHTEPDARARALAEAASDLGLRAEEELVENDGSGYRDAAVVMRVVRTDLDAFLVRAAREIRDDDELRTMIEELDDPDVRRAIVVAVESLAEHLGVRRERGMFLDWLRWKWGLPFVAT